MDVGLPRPESQINLRPVIVCTPVHHGHPIVAALRPSDPAGGQGAFPHPWIQSESDGVHADGESEDNAFSRDDHVAIGCDVRTERLYVA